MKVGELANLTGISVRMLHHYDEIGLLKPSIRSDSGHRIYSKDDVTRLHKILTLRGIGLSLEETHAILGKSPSAVLDVVDRQIEYLESEIATKQRAVQKLKTAQELLQIRGELTLERILEAVRSVAIFEGHLSSDELVELAKRDAELRSKGIADFEAQANTLIQQFRGAMERKLPPSSAEAQKIMKEWWELAKLMTAGDSSVQSRIKQTMQAQPMTMNQLAEESGITQELLAYMKEAGEILKTTLGE